MPRSPNVVTDFIDLTLEEETEDEYPSPRPFFELPRVVDLTDPPPVKRGTKRRRVPSDHWLDHEYYETTETDSYGSSSREFEARPQNNQGTSFQIGTYNLGLKTVDPRKAYTGSFEDDDDVLDDEIIPIEITPEVVENDESGVTLDITEDTENRHFNQSVVHEVDDQDINRKLLVFDDAWDDGGSESMDISSSSGSAGESSRGEGTPEILRRSTPIRTWIKFDVERKDNEVEENENEENSPVDVDLGEMGAVGNEDRDDEVMEVDNECLQDELVEVNDECDAIEDVGNEGLEDETEDMDNEGLEDETEDMENEGLEDETEDMENKGLEEDETEDADDEILCWGKVDVREVEKNQQVNWSVTAGVAEGGANGAEKGDRTPPNTSAMVKRNLDVGIDPTMLSPKRALTVAKSKNRHREVDEISDLSSVPASCRELSPESRRGSLPNEVISNQDPLEPEYMCTLQIARRKHPKTNRVLPDMLYDVRVRTLGGKSLILVAGCGKAAVYEQKTVGRALQLRQQWSFEDQIPPVTETGIETTPERTRKGSESGTDEDGSQDEPEEEEPPDVYACDWALDVESRTAYACVGGWRGFLCVLVYQGWGNGALTDQKKSFQATRFLEGHGGSVNEIKTHPTETAFVLTASEDRSIRLWHAPSGRMCAIWVFGGVGETVRGGVLSVAWGKGGKEIVAGETDGIVRVWKADTPAVLRAMKHCTESPDPLSYSRHPSGSIIPGPSYLYDSSQVKSEEIVPMVAFETRPLWSSRWVFHDRIDWVAEFGGGYLAKGSKGGGEIRAFVPLLDRPHSTFSSDASVMILSRLTYGPKGPAHWFVRAALSPSSRFLSVGCRAGDAWVWDLPTLRETAPKAKDDGLLPPILRASKKLPRRIHKKLKPKSKERALEQCQIRAVSFSEDEKWMVGVSDQAWVRLWALTKKPVP